MVIKMYGVIELFWIAVFLFTEPCQSLHVHPTKLHNFMSKRDLSRYFGVETHDEVPEYDVVHPVQVDSQGNYLTHHLKGAFRRSTDAAKEDTSKIHYKLNAFGEDLHLTLTKNHALMAPTFKSNVLGKNGKILRSRKLKNCHYHGKTKSHETSKVAISNCKGLTGIIKTPKSSYFIEPIPEHLKGKLKPNGVKQPHLIFKNHGYQKRKHVNSDTRVKEESHVVNFCGTKDNSSIKLDPLFHDVIGDKKATLPTANKPGSSKIIEAHLVVDQKMANFHGLDSVEQFALSAVNIAANVLTDYTIGQFPLKYSLVQMSILTAPQMGLVINHHATNTLNSLGEWAQNQNKVDDNDPDHFDHVTLFTRYNICADSDQPCDTLGLAPLSGMCRFPSSATVNQDNGLLVGLTLAHETGHNLGMNHDYIGGCPDRVNVMATSASGKASAFEWSSCSRNFVSTFLKLEQATCLNDEPQKRVKDLDQLEKPGVLYNADTQCSDTFGQGSTFCSISDRYVKRMCFQMWCKKPNNPRSCSTAFQPAAGGTKCGEKKWCKRGVCVEKGGEPPKAIDGGWSKWSEFSDCSRTCDGGIQILGRTCDSPQPQNGGKDCEGESNKYKLCNLNACPPQSENFLNVQCKEKNDKIFGDRMYKWEYCPSDLKNPCELGCFIERSDIGYAMGPVKDGTNCATTTLKGKCINGVCRQVGCDGVIDSCARPDRCGVCNGDGSSCAGKGKYFKLAKYLDGIPKNKQFTWMTVVSNCSVPCAGGIVSSTSECRRVDDNSFVGESFCNAEEKPPKKELPCNTQPCLPTWYVDDWEDCSKTCSTGVRRRNVKCVQVVKENTDEVIEEGICVKTAGQKPPDVQKCNTFPCEVEWLAKNFGKCTTTCGEGVRERAVVCIRPGDNGQNSEVPEAECTGLVKPFLKEKCNEENPCPGEDGCGGTFYDARGKLSSPGFPNDYPNEQDCVYSINVEYGSKIKVSFDSFKIVSADDEPEGQEQCTGDRLELYDGDCAATELAAITKYCGGNKPDPYLSTANQLCIKFISDSAQSASGFNANYVACTGKCDGTEAPPPSAPMPGVAAGQPSPGLTPITGAQTPITGAQTPITGEQPKPGLNDVIGSLKPIKSFNSDTSTSSPRESKSPTNPLEDSELTASPSGGSETSTNSPSGDATAIDNPSGNTGVPTDPLREGAAIGNPGEPKLLRERPKTSNSSLQQTTVKPDDDEVEEDDNEDDDDSDDEMNEDDEQDKNAKIDRLKEVRGNMVLILKKDYSPRPDKP